ncbi:uncharacterized protein LOC126318684 [Schistocerca gregaria]|uniref:uncharacterized protein LOC126318684 n=1 Tax=Schistocerca gregaria TaxID=7010 RepID=UPI00211E2979|nr:uncharacterized protein LOC126318684 [Schistocerca gregaria]
MEEVSGSEEVLVDRTVDSELVNTEAGSDTNSDSCTASKTANDAAKESTWQVSVSGPRKQGENLDQYMTYTITIKTSHPDFIDKEFNVVRRYSDFEWVRNRLISSFRGYIIPPLPEKTIINRFDEEFIVYRRRELERFLKRIVLMEDLLRSDDLVTFLQGPEHKFVQLKSATTEQKMPYHRGFIGLIKDKITTAKPSSVAGDQEEDSWFEDQRKYWMSIGCHFNTLLTRSHLLTKRIADINQVLSDFSAVCNTLSNEEAPVDPQLSGMYKKLSETINQLGSIQKDYEYDQKDLFTDTLKDWIRIIRSIEDVFEDLNHDRRCYQNSIKSRENKQNQFHRHPSSDVAQLAMNEAEVHENSCRNRFRQMSKTSREELKRVLVQKRQELMGAMRSFVQGNMNYHLGAASLWKEALTFEQTL